MDRIRLAKRGIAKLEKNLARLTIDVPAEARVSGLSIQRGGERVGEGAWGTAVPVDPGITLTISASAEGHRSWSTDLSVSPAEQKTLIVPKLEKLPPRPPETPPKKLGPDPAGERSGGSSRIAAYVAGGVGVVALGIGTYFGVRALSKQNAAEKHGRAACATKKAST